jgi:trimeric autotransporter adhesin
VTTNSAGTLILTFNTNSTQILVSKAMQQQIAYANSSDAPPASLQIDWTFSDENTGLQGGGGALSVTGNTTVNITAVNDAPVLFNPIPDVAVTANTSLSYVIPSNTFTDIDCDNLTYALAMSDGTATPPWLTFNSSTRTLSGYSRHT